MWLEIILHRKYVFCDVILAQLEMWNFRQDASKKERGRGGEDGADWSDGNQSEVRDRGSAQRGQVYLLQRADQDQHGRRGKLPLLHDRP